MSDALRLFAGAVEELREDLDFVVSTGADGVTTVVTAGFDTHASRLLALRTAIEAQVREDAMLPPDVPPTHNVGGGGGGGGGGAKMKRLLTLVGGHINEAQEKLRKEQDAWVRTYDLAMDGVRQRLVDVTMGTCEKVLEGLHADKISQTVHRKQSDRDTKERSRQAAAVDAANRLQTQISHMRTLHAAEVVSLREEHAKALELSQEDWDRKNRMLKKSEAKAVEAKKQTDQWLAAARRGEQEAKRGLAELQADTVSLRATVLASEETEATLQEQLEQQQGSLEEIHKRNSSARSAEAVGKIAHEKELTAAKASCAEWKKMYEQLEKSPGTSVNAKASAKGSKARSGGSAVTKPGVSTRAGALQITATRSAPSAISGGMPPAEPAARAHVQEQHTQFFEHVHYLMKIHGHAIEDSPSPSPSAADRLHELTLRVQNPSLLEERIVLTAVDEHKARQSQTKTHEHSTLPLKALLSLIDTLYTEAEARSFSIQREAQMPDSAEDMDDEHFDLSGALKKGMGMAQIIYDYLLCEHGSSGTALRIFHMLQRTVAKHFEKSERVALFRRFLGHVPSIGERLPYALLLSYLGARTYVGSRKGADGLVVGKDGVVWSKSHTTSLACARCFDTWLDAEQIKGVEKAAAPLIVPDRYMGRKVPFDAHLRICCDAAMDVLRSSLANLRLLYLVHDVRGDGELSLLAWKQLLQDAYDNSRSVVRSATACRPLLVGHKKSRFQMPHAVCVVKYCAPICTDETACGGRDS